MTMRAAARSLLVLAVALPVVAVALTWAGGLLRTMGDAAGARAVGHVATACQVAWLVSLAGLVIALAFVTVGKSQESRVESQEGEGREPEGQESRVESREPKERRRESSVESQEPEDLG